MAREREANSRFFTLWTLVKLAVAVSYSKVWGRFATRINGNSIITSKFIIKNSKTIIYINLCHCNLL